LRRTNGTASGTPIVQEMHDRLATEEQQLIGKERSAQLTRISAPFVLRRSADINAKYLPAKEQFVVFCRLTRAQERIYKEVGRAALYGLGGSPPLKPFTAIHLLRQLCNSIKLMRLAAKGDEGGAGGSNELGE
jgi:DNA repair and recombination RAD54-like protein